MDGIANHLDDLNALGDEDPYWGESNDDVATHLELSFDRAFAPFPLKMRHQILQFPFCLGLVTNLSEDKSIIVEGEKEPF